MVDFANLKLPSNDVMLGSYAPGFNFILFDTPPTFTGVEIPTAVTFDNTNVTYAGQNLGGTINGLHVTFTYEGYFSGPVGPVYVFSEVGGQPGAAIAISPNGPVLGAITQPLISGAPPNICFLAGTLIATPSGETAIEDLSVGDLVSVRLDGQTVSRPVTWIGSSATVVGPKAHRDDYPVCIRANAIADGVPHADLLVTAEHCIHLDGKLIPARMLINGSSIVADTSLGTFTYFHLELENHAILIANGVESESYLDTGNRANFHSARVTSLRPTVAVDATAARWTTDAAAALTVDRATVEPIWNALNDRAATFGLSAAAMHDLTNDPALHLLTDTGILLAPTSSDGTSYGFVVPGDVRTLHLASRSSRPSDVIGSFVDDRREFGVLVGNIAVGTGIGRTICNDHLSDATLAGWHRDANTVTARWTTGYAVLPIDLSASTGPISLHIEILSAGPYVAPVTLDAIAA